MSDEFALGVLLPLVFVVAGVFLLAVSALGLGRTNELLSRAREARGEVVRLEQGPKEANEERGYRPVVAFVTDRGQRIEIPGQAYSYPPRYAQGAQVRVLYDPARPTEARIRSFLELWGLATLLGVLGLLLAALGAALLAGWIPL